MAYYGPSLPPKLLGPSKEIATEQKYGPLLPSEAKTEVTSVPIYGPSLPRQLQKPLSGNSNPENNSDADEGLYGPPLPPHLVKRLVDPVTLLPESRHVESDSDDEVYGPLPPSAASHYNEAEEFEKRAKKMKDKLTGKHNLKPERDTWMLELPEEKAKEFGLGPRGFSSKAPSDAKIDKEGWTDTPGQAKSVSHEKISEELIAQRIAYERDEQMEKIVAEKDGDRRKESLLEKHKKGLKRKAQEDSSTKKERKTFDRDKDLAIHNLDAAQKKAVIRKAQQLDTRFSAGNQKFL